MKAKAVLLGGLGVSVLLSIMIIALVPRKQIERPLLIVASKLVNIGGISAAYHVH